jgi:hypothetical protein
MEINVQMDFFPSFPSLLLGGWGGKKSDQSFAEVEHKRVRKDQAASDAAANT